MPVPPTDLKKTETLGKIVNPGTDPGDYPARHGEAVGAVERLNLRVNGWRTFYACVKQALETGTTLAVCGAIPSSKPTK